jgi:hypothetical protein
MTGDMNLVWLLDCYVFLVAKLLSIISYGIM